MNIQNTLHKVLPALSLAGLLVVGASNVQADAAKGEQLFGQCRACHQIGPNAKHLFGPTLNGVMEADAASADGYVYSDALKKKVAAGLSWTDEAMDAFLASPMSYVAGTKMGFAGVASEDERASLISYLKSIDRQGNTIGSSDSKSVEQTQASESANATTEERPLASEFDVPKHGVLHLGRVALEEEVLAWDIDVRPDGTGLPIGEGSVSDGGELYDAGCASCHGDFGEGTGRWPILAGGLDTLREDRPEKTIGSYWPYLSTVYDYVRRAMPFGNARSLSDDDVYAITAYLLYLNDLVDEDFVLTSDNFTSIRLPNEENFIADNRLEEAFRHQAEPCMTDCIAEPAAVVQRARVLDVTPEAE